MIHEEHSDRTLALFDQYKEIYQSHKSDIMDIFTYLDACKDDSTMYASPYENLIKAIGSPEIIDTRDHSRLGRIFQNRMIKKYKAFEGFYGIENVIENIVSFLTRAMQGLEEAKQVLYLLGPVGGGKSSLATRLKELAELEPFYVLKAGDQISPIFESPLGLFSPQYHRAILENAYGIPRRKIPPLMSPWASKRLEEFEGDLSKFEVVKLYPSILNEVGIAVATPGDENTQDISTLVGKVDIRKLEELSQNDPDAYNFSGALCRGSRMVEAVEMFKWPPKTLHPLLTATQEHFYKATEGLSAIPFMGFILAHSNETEWQQFRNDRANEAIVDRVTIIKVPYCLRVEEEVQIYDKLIRESELVNATCAPGTTEMMAKFSVLSRMKDPGEVSTWRAKLRVYNGEDIRDTDPKAKSVQEYRDTAGVNEGMQGVSTRMAFRVLSKTFNYGPEIAANPVDLISILKEEIMHAQYDAEKESLYLQKFQAEILFDDYKDFVEKEIREASLAAYDDFGQNKYERYIKYADVWNQNLDYRDPATGQMYDRTMLDRQLSEIEKPAGITNPKEFRADVVSWYWRAKGQEGREPHWKDYVKIADVIAKNIFSNTEEMMPIISFTPKSSSENETKHSEFVQRFVEKGYTPRQVRLLVEWFEKVKKSS
jgi:serine protein kinase